ncbi:hypothetical protein INR49_021563, partial [Caranx melampygus]
MHHEMQPVMEDYFFLHFMPLVYSVSTLLPVAYIIGLIFTLKTHSHIYNIHVGEGQVTGHHGAVVHWSRWRSLVILIMATVLTSACADLVTEHIQPILNQSTISQYFIGVTVLAMVPEIPEIVNGIQFALQNNISLSDLHLWASIFSVIVVNYIFMDGKSDYFQVEQVPSLVLNVADMDVIAIVFAERNPSATEHKQVVA